MFFEDIDHFGLPGAAMLYTPDSTEAGAAFARDCWEMYCSNNAFKVNLLMYLPELLLRTLTQSARGECGEEMVEEDLRHSIYERSQREPERLGPEDARGAVGV